MTPEFARLVANPALVAAFPVQHIPALLLELAGHQTQLGAELERDAALAVALAARLAALADPPRTEFFAGRLTVTAEELAAAMGRPVAYIRHLCRRGGVRANKAGKYWSIPVEAARAWATATNTTPVDTVAEVSRWLAYGTEGGATAPPTPGPDASRARPAPRRSRAHRHALGDGRAADPAADGPPAPAPGRRGWRRPAGAD